MSETPSLNTSTFSDTDDSKSFSAQFLQDLELSVSPKPSKSRQLADLDDDANAFTTKLLKDLPVPPSKGRPRSAAGETSKPKQSVSFADQPPRRRSLSVSFDESHYKSRLSLPSPSSRPQSMSVSSSPKKPVMDTSSPVGYFSAAFVENLQKQHKDRITDSITSSNRLLTTKEAEVKRLQEQLNQVQKEYQSKEETIKSEVAELRRLFDKQIEKVKADSEKKSSSSTTQLEAMKEEQRRELLEQQCQYEEDCELLKAEHSREISSLKAKFQEEREGWGREKEDMEAEFDQEFEQKCNEYKEQIEELEKELSRDARRLSETRDELCTVSLQKGNEVLELQSRLDENNRTVEVLEEKIKSINQRHQSEIYQRDGQWSETVNTLKRTLDKERACSGQAIAALQQRVLDFDLALRECQSDHKGAISEASSEVSKLSEALSKAREAVEIHKSVANDRSAEVARLQQEIEVLRNELDVSEYERKRAKEQEGILREEINKYHGFIYGKR
ncbi:hypothetical protein GEMRC1_010909 [Eukaryota sp. GEM-RC1]